MSGIIRGVDMNRDYVLTVAQEVLLKAITTDYRDDREALFRMVAAYECWEALVRDGNFPGISDIRARLESMDLETPVFTSEDGVSITLSFIYDLYARDGAEAALFQLSQALVFKYMEVVNMQADFTGNAWEYDKLSKEQEAVVKLMISEYAISPKLPDYITVLLDAGLLRKLDVTHYTPDSDNHTGEYNGRTWGEVVIEVLEENGKKPATWTDLFRDGYIVKANGKPYAPNAWHNLKSRKFKHKCKKI